jgi:chorismate mutase
VTKIGTYKKRYNLSAFQVKRWDEVRSRFLKRGKHLGLDEEFLVNILELIHQESIRIQTNVFREKEN